LAETHEEDSSIYQESVLRWLMVYIWSGTGIFVKGRTGIECLWHAKNTTSVGPRDNTPSGVFGSQRSSGAATAIPFLAALGWVLWARALRLLVNVCFH
jgi:hypothetical protein